MSEKVKAEDLRPGDVLRNGGGKVAATKIYYLPGDREIVEVRIRENEHLTPHEDYDPLYYRKGAGVEVAKRGA